MTIPKTISKKDALEFYKVAVNSKNTELKLFWQRSLFFAGFIAVIFVGFYSIKDNSGLSENIEVVRSLLLILGVYFSLAWCLANRGSKYWYEVWEGKVIELEKTCWQLDFFSEWVKPQKKFFLYQARMYSVSKLAIFLSDLVFLAWIILLLSHFSPEFVKWVTEWRISILTIPLLALLLLLFLGTRTTVSKEIISKWKKKD